ncbi:long-chain fatty acid--CoA ligase [Rugosimonospora acidiphila]|uniref:Acyl-CoA synthetase n=1 Tax=Rugosimonospora acidiphila TaxID=556531 RepID=A0ABP9SV61_9ACTN
MSELLVPPAVATIDDVNLTDVVWDNAERFPDAVQFVRRMTDEGAAGDDGPAAGAGWTPVTCRQFRDEVTAVARGIVAAGIEPGERVGLLSRTRYEWTLLDYAIWAAGAVSVPMYETSSADQAAWILSDSGAVACVVESDAQARMVAGIRDRTPTLREVWRIDAGDVGGLISRGEAVSVSDVHARRRRMVATDLATIIYTSGTTGRPKGCMLSHRNLDSNADNAVSALPELFAEGASTMLFLPLAHAFARLIQIGVVRAHMTMTHTSGMQTLAGDLRERRPTFLLSVPRMLEKIHSKAEQEAKGPVRGWVFRHAERTAVAYSEALETRRGARAGLRLSRRVFDWMVYRKLREALGGRCRHVICGGAPLNTHLGHFFRGAGMIVLEGYGLTETSAAATVNPPGAARIGTVGRPVPGVAIRIDDDTEILIRGDLVISSYWNNPDATAEAFTTDGWLRSGDLGELDPEGYLRVTGRKKEIIVTAAGKHVVPTALEERVRAHSLISHCVVVGDRQPFVAALITIDRDAWPRWLTEHGCPRGTSVADMREDRTLHAEIQTAIDDANMTVSHPEAIKKFRILPCEFSEAGGELTATLKVKRDVVQRACAGEIAAIYQT